MSSTEKITAFLCGFSCDTAIDGIIEYLKQPDCSMVQEERLYAELQKTMKEYADRKANRYIGQ